MAGAAGVGIDREQAQRGSRRSFCGLVDHRLVRADQRRQLRQHQPADGAEVALALQHVGELGEVGLQPVLLGVALRRQTEVVDHGVELVLQLGHLAQRVDLDRPRQVALGDGGRHLGDGADLGGEVGGQHVDVAGQVLPGAGDARHLRLAAELALGADLARHAGHFAGEAVQLIDHRVDGLLELQDLAAHVDGDLLRQVAAGHGGGHLGDVADLGRSGWRPAG